MFSRITRVFTAAGRASAKPARRTRLAVEALEDRAVPVSFTAATVADLVADISAANAAGGANTITLAPGARFTLTAADNSTDGPTGLPVIAANDDLTILGSGDIVERSTASGTPAFRLLSVAPGAALTVNSAILQGGLASGSGLAAEGGAVFNQGTLDLNSVTVQNNTAQGAPGYATWGGYLVPGDEAYGGGVYSQGTLTLAGCTLQYNAAIGGRGADGFIFPGDPGSNAGGAPGGPGGNGFGGGLCVAGGTATISNTAVNSNTAQGGAGGSAIRQKGWHYSDGAGGNAFGGGLAVTGGAVTLRGDSATDNSATGGTGSTRGQGVGGGFYIDAAGWLGLDSSTLSHVKKNHASARDNDISGTYSVIV
jgi:hypothetical protein